MALSIYTNVYANIAQGGINKVSNSLDKSIQRLATGLRINSAADDAAGLSMADRLRAAVKSYEQASRNAQSASSMLNTADTAMDAISGILTHMRELAVQAAGGTANDRATIQEEMITLRQEINNIANAAEFNGKKLLNGDMAGVWSATSADVEAIMRSSAATGSYKLTYSVDPGKNEIYSTALMVTHEDMARVVYNNSTASNIAFTGELAMWEGGNINFAGGGSTTSLISTNTAITAAGSMLQGMYFRDAGGAGGTYVEYTFNSNASANGDTVDFTATVLNPVTGETTNVSGSYLWSASYTFIVNGETFMLDGAIPTAGRRITAGDQYLFYTEPLIANNASFSVGGNISLGFNRTGATSLTGVTLDKTGFHHSTISWNNAGASTTAGEILTEFVRAGSVARSDTKLNNLNPFYATSGASALGVTRNLTVYGNNASATLAIEGDDTIADLMTKIRSVLVNDLSMGGGVSSGALVRYVSAGGTAGGTQVGSGAIVIQSGITGKDSIITFTGDDDIVDALGLMTIQRNVGDTLNATVTTVSGVPANGTYRSHDGMVRNIIPGADIYVNTHSGATATANANGVITFTTKGSQDAYINVVNRAMLTQVGIGAGQTMESSIGRVDARGLELNHINVGSTEGAARAIGAIDEAMNRLGSIRATVGAQMSALEYIQRNINSSRQTAATAESNIRDLDIAEESARFLQNKTILESAMAMLAQANAIPQLVLGLIVA
ncbi:flagellin [Deferribacterales bacterium RsTz2092]|nr:flagellin [Deferribacterales bacterium]